MVVNTSHPLHIVLHQPLIPQNTGNIGRTCVALGAKLWLVRPLGFQLDERHLRRAGLDYWQHLEWEVVDQWEDLLSRIPSWNPWYFSKSATQLYSSVSYQAGDALVFGRETTGLPRSWIEEHPDRAVRIPIRPLVRSLNLSNAVAVAAFEAIRQWNSDAIPP